MRPTILIRIAAVLALLFAIGHTAGRPWTPTHGAGEAAAVAAMRDVHFTVLGSRRSYWDFYQGFGIALSGLFAVQAVLIWLLAGTARDGGRYKGPVVAHLVAFLFIGAVSAHYIFPMLLWFALAIAACLALSLVWRPKASAVKDAAVGVRPGNA